MISHILSTLVLLIVLVISRICNSATPTGVVGGAAEKESADTGIPQAELSKYLFPMFDKYKTSDKTHAEYSTTKDRVDVYGATFKELGINTGDYSSFLDICALPGSASLHILDDNPKITGVGLSLHPNSGGYKPDKRLTSHSRYQIKYHDLLSTSPALPDKFDFAYGACFIKHNVGKKTARDLYASGFKVVIDSLRDGGDFLYLLSYSWNVSLLLDTIEVLSKYFTTITLYKDPNYTGGLSNIFLWCQGRKSSNVDFNDYINNYPIYSDETLKKYKPDINKAFMIMNIHHISLI